MKLKKIFIYVGVLTTFLFVFGCEKPATSVETPVEVVEETVVEDPAPVVEEPEVIESVEEPETTEEEIVEEVAVPNFILYDENGDYYQPQHITLDEFYAKVDEVIGKYEFANDWERDVYVSNLMAYNAGYMDAKDIDTVYHDYLENLGVPVIMQQKNYLGTDIAENVNKVAMADYFIDPVLADEAAIFEKYIDSKSAYMGSEKFNSALRELKKDKGIETYDGNMYNSLLDLERYVFGSEMGKNVSEFYDCDGYAIYYANNCSGTVYYQNIKKYENNFENYEESSYVSSHQE